MTVTVNGITFSDVFSLGHNDCELTMVFNKDHKYSSMEEIEAKLNKTGLSAGNFYFKGVSMWDYPKNDGYTYKEPIFDENGETSLLCMIPTDIRDNFQIDCRE